MKSFIVTGSGEQKLHCGIDLDIVVYGAESAEVEEGLLVFRDKNGLEVRRFTNWKTWYCSGEWQDEEN